MVSKGHPRWHGGHRRLSHLASAQQSCINPATPRYLTLPAASWGDLVDPSVPAASTSAPHSEGLCASPWVCQCGRSLGPRSVLVPCPQPGCDSASTEPQFPGPPNSMSHLTSALSLSRIFPMCPSIRVPSQEGLHRIHVQCFALASLCGRSHWGWWEE